MTRVRERAKRQRKREEQDKFKCLFFRSFILTTFSFLFTFVYCEFYGAVNQYFAGNTMNQWAIQMYRKSERVSQESRERERERERRKKRNKRIA